MPKASHRQRDFGLARTILPLLVVVVVLFLSSEKDAIMMKFLRVVLAAAALKTVVGSSRLLQICGGVCVAIVLLVCTLFAFNSCCTHNSRLHKMNFCI